MQIDPTLRALADPTRLRIMRLLSAMELAVGELAQVLGQSQPRVSRHVKILCDAGLARRRKEGSWVFLNSAIAEDRETATPTLGGATTRLLSAAEREDIAFAQRCEEDRRHLAAIRAGREASAAAYFERNAAQWDQMRKLLADDAPVEAALEQALLADGPLGAMLDVGTGTGRMAQLFSPHASHVTALTRARRCCASPAPGCSICPPPTSRWSRAIS
jgi:ArsR family transcriptional regulator